MQAQRQALQEILTLASGDQNALTAQIADTLERSRGEASQEVWKSRWELLLKSEIIRLAGTEGQALKQAESTYYNDLHYRLDLALTFTEHEACDVSFPFLALQDLLETQTVASCAHIFSWVEARAVRLRAGMVPSKGKALVLLRTLNDLLRRLSKTGGTTLFCGRILTFLSGVFPLGERSGVNLRGEYGPTWQTVQASSGTTEKEEEEGKMDVDEIGDAKTKEKADFYETFWSLQLPFSRPSVFLQAGTLESFKEAVGKVLPAIKEASTKDRALMGSKTPHSSAAALKRKRATEQANGSQLDYFFAKYLTSPELLDLEIADVHFRRQVILQLVILLHHLLTFTKEVKSTWQSTRNRSLQMDDFTLEQADAQWVTETLTRANEELRNSAPGGRLFAETVNVLMEREKNWVKWKANMCGEFEKERWAVEVDDDSDSGEGVERKKIKVGIEGATRNKRLQLSKPEEDWKYRLGSEPLTDIWDMGYRSLRDLENPFQPGDVKDFAKKIQMEDRRIEMRRKQLTQAAERQAAMRVRAPEAASSVLTPVVLQPPPEASRMDVDMAAPTPVAAPSSAPIPASALAPVTLPSDGQTMKFEAAKQRWSWLALRVAREEYSQLLKPDISELAAAIEKEKLDRERARREQQEQQEAQEHEDPASITEPGDRFNSPVVKDELSSVFPATPAIELSSLELPGSVKAEPVTAPSETDMTTMTDVKEGDDATMDEN